MGNIFIKRKTEKFFELLKYSKDKKDLQKFIKENQEYINIKDKTGNSPLMFALKYNHNVDIIKLLINEKTDINQKYNYG